MRKIVGGFAISLDGFIEDPHGEYDWIMMDQEFDFAAHMKKFDTFFIGRKSYEMLIKMGNNSSPHIKSYVFSNTLTEVDKSYTLVTGDIIEKVKQIKGQEGKDIALYGGATLFTSLLHDGLIDEIVLSVMLIILGGGKPMFNELQSRVPLTLLHTQTLASGIVMLTYQVNKK